MWLRLSCRRLSGSARRAAEATKIASIGAQDATDRNRKLFHVDGCGFVDCFHGGVQSSVSRLSVLAARRESDGVQLRLRMLFT